MRILIIYTGGTIGMVKTQKGYAPDSARFRSTLERITDLNAPDVPEWDMLELEPLLDSSNIAVSEWNKIGQVITQNYDRYDGFLVLHGTDTMAYTASALSFMLEGLDIRSSSPDRRSPCARSAATAGTVSSPPCSSPAAAGSGRWPSTSGADCCGATGP